MWTATEQRRGRRMVTYPPRHIQCTYLFYSHGYARTLHNRCFVFIPLLQKQNTTASNKANKNNFLYLFLWEAHFDWIVTGITATATGTFSCALAHISAADISKWLMITNFCPKKQIFEKMFHFRVKWIPW